MIVHPNASLTILSIAEGPDGLLWLATTSGVHRFDGFHYDKITGYPLSSARFIGFTRDGSLWAGYFQGLVRYRDGQFEIVLRDDVHQFRRISERNLCLCAKTFPENHVGWGHPSFVLPSPPRS